MADGTGTTSYAYDELDRLTSVTRSCGLHGLNSGATGPSSVRKGSVSQQWRRAAGYPPSAMTQWKTGGSRLASDSQTQRRRNVGLHCGDCADRLLPGHPRCPDLDRSADLVDRRGVLQPGCVAEIG